MIFDIASRGLNYGNSYLMCMLLVLWFYLRTSRFYEIPRGTYFGGINEDDNTGSV